MVNFYGRTHPNPGEFTVCRIDGICDNSGGFWVELLEYDNRAGFVGLSEITQAKWLRNFKNLVTVGDIEVMQVVRVGNNDDIDLTKRYISEQTKEETLSKYRTWKRVYDYLDRMVPQQERDNVVDDIVHPYLCRDTVAADKVTTADTLSEWVENSNIALENATKDILSTVLQLVE